MNVSPAPMCDDSTTSLSQRVRHWPFWTLNGPARTLLSGAELLAVLLTTVAVAKTTVTPGDLARFALLAALGIGYAEAADRVERFKRYLGSDKVWSNHTSVWAFAGAMLLPAGYAGVLVALIYAHVLILGRHHQSVRPHRLLFTASTMVLATLAAATVIHKVSATIGHSDAIAMAASTVSAMAIFPVVNLGVLLAGMGVATRQRFSRLLPGRDVIGFELITIVLGVVTAEFVLHTVWLTPVVLSLVAALHRSSLVKDLQIAATTDDKTGLLKVSAWRQRAAQGLNYAGREHIPVAVALIDLDHFKRINDTHGHLTGDEVLVRVAHAMRREIRDHDVLARFGGEEFVVFLQGTSMTAAIAIADRLRARIAEVEIAAGATVTASIGLAHTTRPAGVSLDELLEAADRALYEAKDSGRDRVHLTQLSLGAADII